MIEGRSILCFAHDWGGDPTSKTHIMRLLARRNRVVWVNSIAMRRPMASRRDVRRLFDKLARSFAGCTEVEPNLFVVNPLALPLPGSAVAQRANATFLAWFLRRTLARVGAASPLLWTFLPSVNRLVGRLGERMVIYHCVDKYAEFSGVPRQAILAMERDLLRRADLVFASARQLCEECRTLNPNTHFVDHGVDVPHFERSLSDATAIPESLALLPRPIVGFFGLIADWVDLPLIRTLALARPRWSFVLIGKTVTDATPLRGLPNVHCVGQKPYADLPAYCRGFDVAVIPFRRNELTQRVNPLKLREYLAAGLPVVATPLPEISRYDGLVHLAEHPDAFLAAMETAIAERRPELARRRVDAMRSESWEARVSQMSELIERRMGTPT